MNAVEMAEQLKGKYREVFEKADLYGSFKGVEEEILEDKLMNLYDLLMEAQHEGKPVEKIIGPDMEKFCKEYFEDSEEQNWWKTFPKRLFRVMVCLMIIEGIDVIAALEDVKNLLDIKTDMTPFLFGFAVAYILDGIIGAIVKPMIFKKNIKPIVYYLISLVVWFGVIIAGVVLLGEYEINIPAFPIFVVSAIYVVIYLIVTFTWRYKTMGRFTKLDKEDKRVKKEFDREMSDKYLEDASASGMAWRFKRLNKKKMRKENAELTQEEFAAKVREEDRRAGSLDKWITVFFAAIVIVPAVLEMINNTIVDGLILGAMLAVLEFVIWRFTVKTEKENSRQRLQILDECEKRGITIVEYAQILKKEKGK